MLKTEIKGWSDRPSNQYQIDPLPATITSDDFLGLYEKYRHPIEEFMKNEQLIGSNTKEKK